MAKEKIGAQIELEGEKEFKKNVTEINQNLKVLGSEMQLVASSFDKQDKSITAITERNKVLNKQIDEQKNKVAELEKALNANSEKYGENDKRTKDWQIQLNKAQAELNKLETNLDNNNKELESSAKGFEDAEKAAKNFSGEVGEAGSVAEDSRKNFESLDSALKAIAISLAASIAVIGSAAVATGKTMYNLAVETAAAGDQIDKSSQQLGLSTQAYQEWDYVLSQNGADVESLKTGLNKLNNTVDDAINGSDGAAEKFGRLGISLDDLAGKSREEIFEKTIAGLQGVEDKSERAAIASDLLGKSSVNLAPLLNQTAESTQELKDKANQLGMVMSDDVINATVEFTDSLDTLQRTFGGVKKSIGANLLPGLTQITDGFIGVISGEETGKEAILEGVQSIVDNVGEILPKIFEAINKFIPIIAEITPQIIGSLIEGITENMPVLMESVLSILNVIIDTIVENLPLIIEGALLIIVALAQGIGEALPELIPAIVEMLATIVNILLENMSLIVEAGLEVLKGLIEGIISSIPILIEALPEIIENIVDFFIENIPMIIDTGIELLVSLVEALPEIINKIVEVLPKIIISIVDALIDNIDKIIEAGVTLFIALVENLPLIILEIVKAAPQIVDAIVDAFLELIPRIVKIGEELIKGIWKGMNDKNAWLINKISGLFDGVVDNIKDFFGIASPSKLFAELGGFMAEGLGIGFDEEMDGIADEMIKAVPTNFDSSLSLQRGIQGTVGTQKILPSSINSPNGKSVIINISEMNVRNDDDINKISKQLYNLTLQDSRANGFT